MGGILLWLRVPIWGYAPNPPASHLAQSPIMLKMRRQKSGGRILPHLTGFFDKLVRRATPHIFCQKNITRTETGGKTACVKKGVRRIMIPIIRAVPNGMLCKEEQCL